MQSFRDYLKENLVLFDGAMGTYIYQKGIFIDKCYDALNLTMPELIQEIHEEYKNAGAMVIESNTFGANQFKLAKHNLGNELEEINRVGVRLAREVAQNDIYVAGSVGPLGIKIAPWGEISKEEAQDAFYKQIKVLCEEGIDVLILETFQDIEEITLAIQAAKNHCQLPIIAQLTVREDGTTIYGVSVEEMTLTLTSLDVDVIGLNCVVGPKAMLDFIERIRPLTHCPISIMPNAGRPQFVDGRTFYMSTPDYFQVYTKRFIEAGARILGGCCGTTPEHIHRMSEAMAQKQTRTTQSVHIRPKNIKETPLVEPVPVSEKSKFAKKIASGVYVSTVEMVSPKGLNIAKQLAGAIKLKENGVDAINIPDGPRASARMNGMALAVMLQEKVGIETILHYTCRDRNLLGMQSDFLGASVLGIKNILAITGDPPMMGDYPEATAVFDIDAIGLTHMLYVLNHGQDIGSKPIGTPTAFFTGVGVDPNAVNLEHEIDRFKQKLDAGAEFAITQPVFDLNALKYFMDKISFSKIPIIAGVWPLISLRNAEFMKYEVPGVSIPDFVMDRIGKYDTKEDQLSAGLDLAKEMALEVRAFTQGIQMSAPFGRYELSLDVLEVLNLKQLNG